MPDEEITLNVGATVQGGPTDPAAVEQTRLDNLVNETRFSRGGTTMTVAPGGATVDPNQVLTGPGGPATMASNAFDGYNSQPKTPPVPPLPAASDPGPYESALLRERDVRSDLNNRFTELGRYSEIGETDYKQQLSKQLVDAGLAPPSQIAETAGQKFQRLGIEDSLSLSALSMGGRLRTNFTSGVEGTGGALFLGYSLQTLAVAEGNVEATENSGKYLTSEQRTKTESAPLTGVLELAGTLAGAAIGGTPGAIGGSLVMGGVGGIAQSFIGAGADREQATRMTAETFTASLGEAASKLNEFKTAIEQTGTPVQQLQQVIGALVSTGPLTGGVTAIAGAGAFANGLGQYAVQDATSMARQLRDPGLFPLSQELRAQGRLDMTGQSSLAAQAILDSDPRALFERERDLQGTQRNPAYIRDKSFVDRQEKGGLITGAENFFFPSRDDAYLAAKKRLSGEAEFIPSADKSATAQINDYFERLGTATYSTVLDAGTLGLGASGVTQSILQGGGTAATGAATNNLLSTLNTARSDQQNRTNVLQQMLNDPAFAGDKVNIQKALNQSLQTMTDDVTAGFQAQRDQSGRVIGNTESDYNLLQTQQELGGASARDLYTNTQRQTARLLSFQSLPGLTPVERNALQGEALQLDYAGRQSIYSQNLAGIDVGASSAGVDVARATTSGGPSDVFSARGEQLGALNSKLAELSNEIQRGVLTADQRLQKEREYNDTLSQGVQLAAGRIQERAMAELGIADTNASTASVGISRTLAIGGNAAFPNAVFDTQNAALSAANQLLSVARTPEQVATARNAVASAQNNLAVSGQIAQTYSPDAATRTRLDSDRTAFEVSQILPFTDGSGGSNPFTRGLAYEGDLRGLERQYRSAAASATDPLAREADTAQANTLKLQVAGLDRQRLTEGFRALPEFIAGSPGAGVLAAAVPTAALSSLFSPNPYVSGGFGAAGMSGGVHSPITQREGGAAGIANQGLGVNTSEMLLRAILSAIERGNRSGGDSRNTYTPGNTGQAPGLAAQNQNLQLRR